MSRFSKLEADDEIIEVFNKIVLNKAFNDSSIFQIIADTNLKKLISIKLISECYELFLNKSVLVFVNPELFEMFKTDENLVNILFEQELDNIYTDEKSGKIKKSQYNLKTNFELIKKHTSDNIYKVNEMEKLAIESLKDSNKRDEFYEKLRDKIVVKPEIFE